MRTKTFVGECETFSVRNTKNSTSLGAMILPCFVFVVSNLEDEVRLRVVPGAILFKRFETHLTLREINFLCACLATCVTHLGWMSDLFLRQQN